MSKNIFVCFNNHARITIHGDRDVATPCPLCSSLNANRNLLARLKEISNATAEFGHDDYDLCDNEASCVRAVCSLLKDAQQAVKP